MIQDYFSGMFSFTEQENTIVARAPIVGRSVGSQMSDHVYLWGTLQTSVGYSTRDLKQIALGETIQLSRPSQGGKRGLLSKLNIPLLKGASGAIDTTLQYYQVRLPLPDDAQTARDVQVDLNGPVQKTGRVSIQILACFTYGNLTVMPDTGASSSLPDQALHFYAEPSCGDEMKPPIVFNELCRMHKLSTSIIVDNPVEPVHVGDLDQMSLSELKGCQHGAQVAHCFSVRAS